jgi:hypothetical protein
MLPLRIVFALLVMAATAEQVQAAYLLLTPAYETQLEDWGWRGENLDFNSIFTHTEGDGKTPYDFHNAADGMGATIVLIEATATAGSATGRTFIIGGYNPVSWRSDNHDTLSLYPAPRTAFVFNLTTATAASQRGYAESDPSAGSIQTSNWAAYGPVFGRSDLGVSSDLNSGNSRPAAYDFTNFGATSTTNLVYDDTPLSTPFRISRLEVLTFSQAVQPLVATPEPTSTTLACFAGVVMSIGAWRRRRQKK